MHFRFYFCLLLLLGSINLWAQEPIDSTLTPQDDEEEIVVPNVDEDTKLGIKIGSGTSILIGGEPNHPRPALYLVGGLYGRYKIKRHWAIQHELNVAYKGSNFNNNVGEYGSIKSYHIELPVMLLHGLDEKNVNNIVAGFQYSRMLNAVIYVVDGVIPESVDLKLNKDDISLIGGAQFHTPFVGFQLLLKYGLLNVNQGLVATIPPYSTGKSMHHLTFELSFIF